MRTVSERKKVRSNVKHELSWHKSLEHLEYAREEVVVKYHIQFASKQSSLAPWKSFMENAGFTEDSMKSSSYRMFTVKPLHNFKLGISKLFKLMYNYNSRI